MALTGRELEELNAVLSADQPQRDRELTREGLENLGSGLGNLDLTKERLDQAIIDAGANPPAGYVQIQADWASNLRGETLSFTYKGKTGIDAVAQVIADLDEQGEVPLGAQLRLYSGGTKVPVDQDAP